MRPQRISVSGFGPFRDPVEIDLSEADFFALVGPTGAGKSSVIDAIAFALYGSVPRHSVGEVTPIVAVGANEARVTLEFDIGSERYVALRVLRRTASGTVQQREARLERLSTGEVLAGSVREMQSAVEGLLGLPYAHFRTCVALPQGEFARFLHDKPADRQAVLVRLLGLDVYANVGVRAREEGKRRRAEAERVAARAADLAFATPEARDAAQRQRDALLELHTRIRALTPRVDELTARANDATERAARAAAGIAQLLAVGAPAGLGDLSDELRDALAAAAATAVDLDQKAAALDAADAAVADSAGLDDLARAQQGHEELEPLHEIRSEVAAEIDRFEAALVVAANQLTARRDAASIAEAELETLRATHARHELARELVVGEPCPVCGTTVDDVPEHEDNEPLDAARERVARARADERSAGEEHTRTSESLTGARNRAVQLTEQITRFERLVEKHPDRATLDALVTAATAAHHHRRGASEAHRDARQKQESATRRLQALEGRRREARRALTEARDALATLDPPTVDPENLEAAWAELVDWAKTEQPALARARDEATAAAKDLTERRQSLIEEVTGYALGLGIEPDTEPAATAITELLTAVVDAGSSARHELDRIESAIRDRERLAKEAERLDDAAAIAEELGRLLSARGFEAWLVEEALEALISHASETLLELSSGYYSLALDDQREFMVIDHRNADERRSARTLSGGETFQASLSLALALSDQLHDLAAEHSKPLEAIFLDEGFGTLDADALDTVATSIETLGARGRMVGIVTHVRELAERVPVRFEVRRAGSSSSVVRMEG